MAVITQDHMQLAAQFGACVERRRAYRVGMDLSRVRFADICWLVDRLGKYAAAFALDIQSDLIVFGKLPTEFSGSGYGYGYGDGDGYGYGDGSGD